MSLEALNLRCYPSPYLWYTVYTGSALIKHYMMFEFLHLKVICDDNYRDLPK
jgi:hypothetical protein